LSFRRKPESSYFNEFWTPAFAGVTHKETFYEITNFDLLVWNLVPRFAGLVLGICL
jgi:hypothetical protein